MRLTEFIRKTYNAVVNFLTKDLWRLDVSGLSRFKMRLVRDLKIVYITIRNYSKSRMGRECVALSYSTTMAMVPLLAVILFVASGFGFDQQLRDMLYESFPTSTPLIDVLFKWASNIISSLGKGSFGYISFGLFVWLVIWLMMCVENAFNRIWRVEKSRKIYVRIGVYLAILFFSPFVLLMFLISNVYYAKFITSLADYKIIAFVSSGLFWLAFYGLTMIIMASIYKFLPHAKVHFVSCVKASLLSAAAFVGTQYLYLNTQLMVTRLGAVYGAFAALPLFMIYMNICWNVVLIGASLAHAFQNRDDEATLILLESGESNDLIC